MANSYYTKIKTFLAQAVANGADVVSELDLIADAFDPLPSDPSIFQDLGDVSSTKIWATEWATKAEDSLVSAAAGGNQTDEYSSLHHAAKTALTAASTEDQLDAATLSAAAALSSENAAAGTANDGDKGSITLSGAGTAYTVDDGAVETTMMDNMVADSLMGRDTSGTGAPEVLTATQVRTLLNVADGANAGVQPKNAIINGNFDLWERGTSSGDMGYHTADRWRNSRSGDTATFSRGTFTPGQTDVPGNPEYYMEIDVVGNSSDSSYYSVLQQRIKDAAKFSGEEVTVDFWGRVTSGTADIATEVEQTFGGSSPNYGQCLSKHELTTTWQRLDITDTLLDVTGETFGADHTTRLNLWLSSGTDYDARSSTIGKQSATFQIAQVQMKPVGSVTTFRKQALAEIRRECSRYFQKLTVSIGNIFRTAALIDMRTIPTVTVTDGSGSGMNTSELTADTLILKKSSLSTITIELDGEL